MNLPKRHLKLFLGLGLSLSLASSFITRTVSEEAVEKNRIAQPDHACSAQENAMAGEIDTAFNQSPDFFETLPDGTLPKQAKESSTGTTTRAIAPAATQPTGALAGRVIFTSGGHGWTYGNGGSGIAR